MRLSVSEVSPIKGVMIFGKKEKLALKYIGPLEIRSRVGGMVYWLVLPPKLMRIHPVFHVSMLRKYIADPSQALPPQAIELSKDLTYEEYPVAIVDWQVRQPRTKDIPMVKVLWSNHSVEDCVWETCDDVGSLSLSYPYLISCLLYILNSRTNFYKEGRL